MANKQDLPCAMSTKKIADGLKLNELQGRLWYIQACCAVNTEGVYEGLDWLAQNIKK